VSAYELYPIGDGTMPSDGRCPGPSYCIGRHSPDYLSKGARPPGLVIHLGVGVLCLVAKLPLIGVMWRGYAATYTDL
jgi:hypothetical protein